MSNKQISGPINVVRLEGTIFGINKVLYVFLDLHMPLHAETQCADIFSKTIKTYLIEQFKKSEITLDFFLETFPIDLSNYPPTNHKKIYLDDLRNMMYQTFKYSNKNNKVEQSDSFPHVRLHYIDIRDYLFWDILWTQLDRVRFAFDDINYKYQCRGMTLNNNELAQFKDELIDFDSNIKNIINLMELSSLSRSPFINF